MSGHNLELAASASHGLLRGLIMSTNFATLERVQQDLIRQCCNNLAEALFPGDERMKAPQ